MQVQIEEHLQEPVGCPAANVADYNGEHHLGDLTMRLLPQLGPPYGRAHILAVKLVQNARVEYYDYDHGQEIVEHECVGVEGLRRRQVIVQEVGKRGLRVVGERPRFRIVHAASGRDLAGCLVRQIVDLGIDGHRQDDHEREQPAAGDYGPGHLITAKLIYLYIKFF